MNRIPGIVCLFLVSAILLMAAPALAERKPLPELLRVKQHTVSSAVSQTRLKTCRVYPDTANAAVNRSVKKIVDRLAAQAEKRLPASASLNGLADTGATVRVTGTKTVSFLVLAHVAVDREQRWSDFETAVYDLSSGKKLKLADFFETSAEKTIREAVQTQLTAYFPDKKAGKAALERLCGGIWDAPFTLSPAYLELHYRASELYAGKVTLMHVRVPYRLLTEHMTKLGRKELDNSQYLLAAMTFDDGPGRGVTSGILETLREWAAMGTFFNLGRPMGNARDYIAWEHDAGHAVQSHTYSHTDRLSDRTVMFREKERFAKEQTEIIGIPPAYMRAPGGNDKLYAKYEIGMPIVRWTTLSGDAVKASKADKVDFAGNMVHTLKPTSIILMHNIAQHSVGAAGSILDRLYQRGYMCVTVDELFEIRGIQMQDNTVYFGDEADTQE